VQDQARVGLLHEEDESSEEKAEEGEVGSLKMFSI
jgi:hypothetical protein